MKPEKQQIAIAEALGYKRIPNPEFREGREEDFRKPRFVWLEPNSASWTYFLSSYLSDLNAMHEAENFIWHSQKLRLQFSDNLNAVCMNDRANCWHATAAQRAEAFLRTIGRWEE